MSNIVEFFQTITSGDTWRNVFFVLIGAALVYVALTQFESIWPLGQIWRA